MRNWKVAFWVCFLFLIVTTGVGIYLILEQSITLTYMKDGFKETENDLEVLVRIVNDTDLSRKEIIENLHENGSIGNTQYQTDTLSFKKITLIFKNNKLEKINRIR